MILSRPANRLSRLFAPLLSGLMILALLASMGIAPVLALAGVCAKPCCSDAAHHASTVVVEAVDGCCELDAPRATHGNSDHSGEHAPSSGCTLEWCCDAGPQSVILQTLPTAPLCSSNSDAADAMRRAIVALRESTDDWRSHTRDAGWPPPTRRHLLHCLLLI